MTNLPKEVILFDWLKFWKDDEYSGAGTNKCPECGAKVAVWVVGVECTECDWYI